MFTTHALCPDALAEWLYEQHSERFFWLPDRIVAAVREIGLQSLVSDRSEGCVQRKALRLLGRVRWEAVDPAASTRPTRNYVGAPTFTSGDVVHSTMTAGIWIALESCYAKAAAPYGVQIDADRPPLVAKCQL